MYFFRGPKENNLLGCMSWALFSVIVEQNERMGVRDRAVLSASQGQKTSLEKSETARKGSEQ